MWGDAERPEQASNAPLDARIGRGGLVVDIARIVDSRAFAKVPTVAEPSEPAQHQFLRNFAPDEKKRLAQHTALHKAELILQLIAHCMTPTAKRKALQDELNAWSDLGVKIDDATRQAINKKFCT